MINSPNVRFAWSLSNNPRRSQLTSKPRVQSLQTARSLLGVRSARYRQRLLQRGLLFILSQVEKLNIQFGYNRLVKYFAR